MDRDLAADALRGLTKAWLGKIEIALECHARKAFLDVADQCTTFFAGTAGEFWSSEFQEKFLGTKTASQFKIQINKAFELVALFGPVLYNRNPVRTNSFPPPISLEPTLFGDPNDPYVQQAFQAAVAQQEQETARLRVGTQLMDRYLNYTPDEQPGGGLKTHGEQAVTDALVTGRGILAPRGYNMPASSRKLTGCFHISYRDLITDPDARKIDFGDTRWIGIRHIETNWEAERRFRLPKGTLKNRTKLESAESQAEREAYDLGEMERQAGTTFDLFEWWELFSVGGAGGRLAGLDTPLKDALDKYVGDFAYICVAKNVEWPLNLPLEVARSASPEEVRRRLSWPVPYWMDRRWPVALLEFYRHPRRAYPIAPMSPGLGELTFLNFLLSRICKRTWDASRLMMAVLGSAKKEVEKALKSLDDSVVFELDDVHKAIDQVISFLVVPDISKDIWAIAAQVMELFDKRTGLTELWYSMSSTQARTATESQIKAEKASIRPEYMAGKVEDFLTDASQMEKLCAHWEGISSRDVQPLLGSIGAKLWDELILSQPPELVAREMRCKVVAGSAKRRNKQLELSNLTELYPGMSQQFTLYAQTTGDSGPANALNDKLCDAMQMDANGLRMQAFMPPQLNEPQISQEDQLAAQMQMEQEAHQAEMQRLGESHAQELQQDAEAHEQELEQKQAEAAQALDIELAKARVQAQLTEMKTQSQIEAQRQGAAAKAALAKKQAAQKPKPQPATSAKK